jgi:hypothetical protein
MLLVPLPEHGSNSTNSAVVRASIRVLIHTISIIFEKGILFAVHLETGRWEEERAFVKRRAKRETRA